MNKGIVLAGGYGTRLYPSTKVISKQLLPLYDKPMIYYPISVLMLANIKEILIISDPENISYFKKLLGRGNNFGVKFCYEVQEKPDGIATTFIIAEKFIGSSNVCLILGDNLFFGSGFSNVLRTASKNINGAHIFAYEVNDPSRFGVVEINSKNDIIDIKEKPKNPKSNYAVTGLYFYDNSVIDIAKKIKISKRGEKEITDVNKAYFNNKSLRVTILGRGFTWLDTGTPDSFLTGSQLIQTFIKKQGLQIACLEEIALRKKWISVQKLKEQNFINYDNDYARYLKQLISLKAYNRIL